jgi:hypothetical protein
MGVSFDEYLAEFIQKYGTGPRVQPQPAPFEGNFDEQLAALIQQYPPVKASKPGKEKLRDPVSEGFSALGAGIVGTGEALAGFGVLVGLPGPAPAGST